MSAVETLELAPGYRISRLIRGGWQLAGDHGAVDRERAIAELAEFPRAGVTTFDGADIYRGVEELFGAFRDAYRRAHGDPALAALRFHTKLVPDADSLPPSRGWVEQTIDRSRTRLRQDRLDLVQLHWWDYRVPGMVEMALQLAELQAAGRIAELGATNLDTPHLASILDAGVNLVALQCQYSLLDRRPEHGIAALCAARGLGLLCYGTLAGGFLTDRWLGAPDPDLAALGNRSLVKYRLIIEEIGGWTAFQALLRILRTIADRHGVSIAAIATRWVLDRPAVAAVIVGARYATHLGDNLGAFAVRLDEEDHALLDPFLAAHPGPPGDTFELERDRSGRHGRIMKYNLNAGSDRLG